MADQPTPSPEPGPEPSIDGDKLMRRLGQRIADLVVENETLRLLLEQHAVSTANGSS